MGGVSTPPTYTSAPVFKEKNILWGFVGVGACVFFVVGVEIVTVVELLVRRPLSRSRR